SELGRLLAERFPGHDADALAQGARAWLPMVQVPPRGVWGRGGRALQTPLETWLGRPQSAPPVRDLVLRYLTAFGPATVRDAQAWSGLTRLAEVFEELGPRLRVDGDLYDLPDAPRPDPDTPAPVRFLYDYDNLLLSHADRSRVFGDSGEVDYAAHGYVGDSNVQPASVLVDGFVAATWTVARQRRACTLTVRGFRRLNAAERGALETEGAALLEFLHPGDEHDVRVEPVRPSA
ncbi:MAG: winged helix DNA-binding domain-containing protein, partial [Actinophytocola sp.]|uniref:winged helix DNA-binding domain-containing protein n=1 Tax=Actinophytocola sp. TaxID=1872138 RepID=UPI003D6A3B37